MPLTTCIPVFAPAYELTGPSDRRCRHLNLRELCSYGNCITLRERMTGAAFFSYAPISRSPWPD